MGFFLKTTLVLLLLLGLADYRYWQRSVEHHEFARAELEAAIFQKMQEGAGLPLQLQSLSVIPGGSSDELGLRLTVKLLSRDDSIEVEYDLKGYYREGNLVFTRPCMRPLAISEAPPVPRSVYEGLLQRELRYGRYSIPVGDGSVGAGSTSGRPVTDVDYSEDKVALRVGLPLTWQRGHDLLVGKAWPECGADL